VDPAGQSKLEQTFREAAAAASANRREEAVRLMDEAATAGLAAAQYYSGIWRIVGFGTFPDTPEGMAWLEAAGAQGFVPARNARAAVYANACGVPGDWEAAKAEFVKALSGGWPGTLREAAVLLDLFGAEAGIVRGLIESAQAKGDPLAGSLREGLSAPARALSAGELARRIEGLPDPVLPEAEPFLDSPKASVFRGLLSPLACRHVRLISPPHLALATVNDPITGKIVGHPDRTGYTGPLYLSDLDLVTAVINLLAAAAAGVPPDYGEELMVLKYLPGQEYRPHFDYLDPKLDELTKLVSLRGQRTHSVLIYLNEDYEGGETEFPRVAAKFRGRTGDALVYRNVNDDGTKCLNSLHAGRPVSAGEKWIVTKWIRDKTQFHGGPRTAP
jgi:prolyl 4-hydroxylase